ncbi:MAG: leucine--tRNA ligase [Candidatus Vogelbacteria bacterium]|nr:leucine--tRNA ligase [Candidatus Vogelbacteria bacterium]
MHNYDHKKIETKWQKKWKEEGLYTIPDRKEGAVNHYVLVEFAYPSGNLHVGHWYAFAVPDMYARYMRMRGYNVLYPFGFDAFGLPAENAAIKRGLNPREWTYDNIAHMRTQLRSMGTMFDWSREIVTSDPEYYKWTQWLFIQLFNRGLAYQAKTLVNWCPSCKTVLANEQVVAGKCERCGSEVTQKELVQWNLKITEYGDRLIDDLDSLEWPESIKEAQKNWIGRSDGYEVDFTIREQKVSIFTTRLDTIFGATYLVLAPEHPLVPSLLARAANRRDVEAYIASASKKSERERAGELAAKEKTGVSLEGVTAKNPANGEEISVWLADYVIAGYGTGAVMAVPAHDERDFAFAQKFNLSIQMVVCPHYPAPTCPVLDDAYTGDGHLVGSGEFSGMKNSDATPKIAKRIGARRKTTYRLRDWTVSRQRYWGCPIPIIHCGACGAVPVPEKDLPVLLPPIQDFLPAGDGRSPLAKVADWVRVLCPKCGDAAERETDTLDTFVDSSWYFLRYLDPKNDAKFAELDKQDMWMPVNFYSGGAEHTSMHLLYSRFFHKALFDAGLVRDAEPYLRRMNRGLILGPDGNKMSKSKGNVIDPDDVVARLGADTVRAYLAFIGPYNEVGAYPWSIDGIAGVRRFLEKFVRIQDKVVEGKSSSELVRLTHKTILQVGKSIERFAFNTGVSALMILANAFDRAVNVGVAEWRVALRLLAPFAPHLAEELWSQSRTEGSVHRSSWPEYDALLARDEVVKIIVQVNGKTRATMSVSPDMVEEDVTTAARALPAVEKLLGGKAPIRVVSVPGRLVNIVI